MKRFIRSRSGAVAIFFALALVPMLIATGAAIDYGHAVGVNDQLHAASDAAALAAASQAMMQESASAAQNTAEKLFMAQARQTGVTINSVKVTVQDTDGSSATTVVSRVVTVTYSAKIAVYFSKLLGVTSWPVSGTSQAKGSHATNIDFYVLVDSSPSMAFPTTSTGIAQLMNYTKGQSGDSQGCAFACHQTTRTASNPGSTVPNKINGQYTDNYMVASYYGIPLRIDVIDNALASLVNTIPSVATQNKASYRMALSHFDYQYYSVSGVTSDFTALASDISQISLLTVCTNNDRVCGTGNSDEDSSFTKAFAGEDALLPVLSGNGTNSANDTPQAVLILLTDGMDDENVAGGRKLGPISQTLCTTLKSVRNIRIAVLYTQFLPDGLSGDSWSKANALPYLQPTDQVGAALQSCASPGLFYEVTTDDDVTVALSTLFQKIVATSYLSE